jgi:hypothetical protein
MRDDESACPRHNDVKRRFTQILAVLSLLLCLALAGLWAWSYRTSTTLARQTASYTYSQAETDRNIEPIYLGVITKQLLIINWGEITLHTEHSVDHMTFGPINGQQWSKTYPPGTHYRLKQQEAAADPWQFESASHARDSQISINTLGVFFGTWSVEGMSNFIDFHASEAAVPIWMLSLATSTLPLLALWRWHRRRRTLKLNACSTCGYSLKGNTSGVCPECGSPATKKPTVLA